MLHPLVPRNAALIREEKPPQALGHVLWYRPTAYAIAASCVLPAAHTGRRGELGGGRWHHRLVESK